MSGGIRSSYHLREIVPMPAKKNSESVPKAAAKPRRARKVAVKAEGAVSPAPKRRAAPKRRVAKVQAKPEAVTTPKEPVQSELPVLSSIPTPPIPLLPVSPREPAAVAAKAGERPAPPVPTNDWTWAQPPLVATAVFLGALSALVLGYWTGYSVASGTAEPAVTIVEAAEKTPTLQSEPPILADPAPLAPEEPADIEPALEETPAEPQSGLHLQVSALASYTAATELQRQLEDQGYPVRIEEPTNDELVRVYVGPVPDDTELSAWSAELRKEGLKPFPKRL
jgi:hypothetical protein